MEQEALYRQWLERTKEYRINGDDQLEFIMFVIKNNQRVEKVMLRFYDQRIGHNKSLFEKCSSRRTPVPHSGHFPGRRECRLERILRIDSKSYQRIIVLRICLTHQSQQSQSLRRYECHQEEESQEEQPDEQPVSAGFSITECSYILTFLCLWAWHFRWITNHK